MADRSIKGSYEDDFRYLSVPRPARGYHSDNELRQKKRTTPQPSSPVVQVRSQRQKHHSTAVESGYGSPFAEARSLQNKGPMHRNNVAFGPVANKPLITQPRSTSACRGFGNKVYHYR
ncbi:hypothetical protein CPAR01_01138 [Colletotrichum paranaense]|uniref:Uncharacterized protein n=1 Tax=Colletotrichum paranaense TaxID=1914294 RepID=A0ABQ9T5W2_9PEZI|nr:uncharacterized protein CPAR01_01138 [Colletotrichum paranaense]KAK1547171.1 hypothetical protein CPAR01_01138 [Colletotrichum paranaense]